MDKKTLLGFGLIAVVLVGFTMFQQNSAKKAREAQVKAAREQFVADSIYRAEHPEEFIVQVDSTATQEAIAVTPEIVRTLENEGTQESYLLENDKMKLWISSLGGGIENAELKNYTRYNKVKADRAPLRLFADSTSKFDLGFYFDNKPVNTSEYYFSVGEKTDSSLVLILPVGTGQLEYRYTMQQGEYMIYFDVRFVGIEGMRSEKFFTIDWETSTLQNEKGYRNENNFTTLTYRFPDERSIEKLSYGTGSKDKEIKTKVQWFGFKQQFFSTTLIADNNFATANFHYGTYPEGSGLIKQFKTTASVEFDPAKSNYGFKMYMGPNDYGVMKPYGVKLEKSIPLGGSWISWFNTGFIIPLFNWLSSFGLGFGLIILIITLVVKIIILPLTFKSYMSTAKMRALKPELDEIAAQFSGKDQETMMKKQQATQALYKQSGVSPLGGCLPMLIQFPIIFAVFRFFPAAIELRGHSFLWADDLSAYDSVLNFGFNIPMYGDHISLFALLMAVSMFFYSRISYSQTSSAAPQMAGMKFMTLYLMPIMMLLWFNSYASGLTYYYFIANLFTMAQMLGFRYFVDEKKLRSKVKMAQVKNAGTTKKKSRWQERYEQALKQQQAMRNAQQSGNTKGQIQGKNTTKAKKR